MARFMAGLYILSYAGAKHGDAAYALLDVVCYLSMVPTRLGAGRPR
jgi:hypothetical protein